MSLSHPSAVTVVEVGPRDGLQNEAAPVSTDDKITFVNLLSAAGLPVVEVSAFVNPKRVPQMADAGEVFARIERRPSTPNDPHRPFVRRLKRFLELPASKRALA